MMFSKSLKPSMLGIACFIIMYGGIVLLGTNVSNGFSQAFSSPLSFISKFVVPLVLIIGGFLGYIRANRYKIAQFQNYSSRDFDAHEAFQQIRTGTTSSDWSVFRVKRKQAMIVGFAFSLVPLYCLLLIGLMGFAVIHDSSSSLYQILIAYCVLCTLLGAVICTPIVFWKSVKNKVLLVTPDGFMSGDCEKPGKALRLKYRDIAEMKVTGETINFRAKDNFGVRALNSFLLAPSFKEIASTLLTAFARYKAEYPDNLPTVAPLVVSPLEREITRG